MNLVTADREVASVQVLGEASAADWDDALGIVTKLMPDGGEIWALTGDDDQVVSLEPGGSWAVVASVPGERVLDATAQLLLLERPEAICAVSGGLEQATLRLPDCAADEVSILGAVLREGRVAVTVQCFTARTGAWRYGLADGRLDGTLGWLIPPESALLHWPQSVAFDSGGALLIADTGYQQAVRVCADGRICWTFGQPGRPGSADGQLRSPRGCAEDGDGVVIADSMNRRVLRVGPDGKVRAAIGAANGGPELRTPTSVLARGGDVVVADAGTGTVCRLDPAGRRVQTWGAAGARTGPLSHPRTACHLGDGTVLVADTNNHRLVVLAGDGEPLREIGNSLFDWPRAACRLGGGQIAVADSFHHRVAVLDERGELADSLERVTWAGQDYHLRGPQYLQAADGGLLLVDSGLAAVMLTDLSGKVRWQYGLDAPGTLADPHCADLTGAGEVVIADSARQRVIVVGPEGQLTSEWTSAAVGWGYPRAVLVCEDAILVGDDYGLIYVLRGGRPEVVRPRVRSAIAQRLGGVRHLSASGGELLVTDYEHHRVVAYRLTDLLASPARRIPPASDGGLSGR